MKQQGPFTDCQNTLSRNTQYKDIYKRTIFKTNCCLRIHNAFLKLASPISDKIHAELLVILLDQDPPPPQPNTTPPQSKVVPISPHDQLI